KIKRNESGMITDPVTISPEATLAEWDDLCGRYRISGLPVVDEHQVLLGIITNRDTRFVPGADYASTKVHEIMTKMPLVTAPFDVARDDVVRLLQEHRIEKLPLVGKDNTLEGLITVKDLDRKSVV